VRRPWMGLLELLSPSEMHIFPGPADWGEQVASNSREGDGDGPWYRSCNRGCRCRALSAARRLRRQKHR
jgi:hypothetical protein